VLGQLVGVYQPGAFLGADAEGGHG
jgi:hypothetical protein